MVHPQLVRALLILTLLPFGALTAAALAQVGYWGIVEPHLRSVGSAQVLVDLVIALALVMVWMVRDARASGRNPWLWIALTLSAGSFGPLLYLLFRPSTSDGPAEQAVRLAP